MRLAIIDKKDLSLKIEGTTIKVDEQTIPFKLVDTLILNHRIKIETKDILKLTKENISILLISYNNEQTAIISSGNTKNGELKQAQYHSLKNRLDFAKYFITQKFIGIACITILSQ